MPNRLEMVLKAARLTMLVAIGVYALLAALALAGVAGELLFLAGLVAVGWIALSALACLVLQLVVVLRWRRSRRG